MFYIKIKIKGNLTNITDNTTDLIDTYAIKNNNKISYYKDNIKYKIIVMNKQVILIREQEEFIHKFIFDIDNITKSEYYIKELRTTLDLPIKTTKLIISEKRILIEYEVIDNNNNYSYILDME